MKSELAKLNRRCERGCGPVAIVLEGRDTAGKSATIRELTHYLNPNWFTVHASRKPSRSTMRNWFSYWSKRMPKGNCLAFFDRSWYSRAMVQRINGWCSETQYQNFLRDYKNWEASQGVRFIKFWLSITEDEQRRRIEARKKSPLTYWKFSENDENALSYYDRMSLLKERVIDSEWIVIDYNEKARGIEALLTKLNEELKK